MKKKQHPCPCGALVPLSVLAALTLPAALLAQQPDKSFAILRVEEPPVIDGSLDDAVWQRAPLVDDFHQVRPVDGGEPSERTEVRMVYTEDFLYIGARLYSSEPERISATVMKHGQSLGQDDRLAVVIDPFNSGRNGYRFETNALGVRHDMLYTNLDTLNADWEVIWDVESQVDDQGWSFEMAIPFKSLPFTEGLESWGINFARAIRRRGEEAVWVSRNRGYNPSIVGRVSGLRGINQGAGLDVVPSAIARRTNPFPGDSDWSAEPSLDVFYRITPSLNGSLTFNTDFSATEVDDRQVNLTRFNLFFPEKRAFFLNDAHLFEFGNIGREGNQATTGAGRQSGRPFFTRRIGLGPDGRQADIDAGAKLSGRAGRWSIGTLAVRQAGEGALDASNLFVSRLQADVLGESRAGVIVTSGDPASNRDNSLIGADFLYLNTRLPGGRTLEGEAWVQKTDTEGLSGDDTAWGLGLSMPNAEGLRGGVEVMELEENFNPALGFVTRRGVRDLEASLGYTRFVNRGFLQSTYSALDYGRVTTLGGPVQTETIVVRPVEFTSNGNDALELKYQINRENVLEPFVIYPGKHGDVVIPPGDYEFTERNFDIKTGDQRAVYGRLNFTWGEFYNGDRVNAGTEFGWRPSPKFNLALNYDWNSIELPQGDFITRLLSARVSYAFFLGLTWDNLIQYDNVSEVMGVNSRLTWNPTAGQTAFLVLNHNWQDFDRDNEFGTLYNELSLKFSYTFRY